MKVWKRGARRGALSVSALALAIGAGWFAAPAAAQDWLPVSDHESSIVPNDLLDPDLPPPGGVLDLTGVIGIGQMITDVPPAGGSVGLCSGTLINPRTVIFAAHCVNDAPASAYGSASGGIAMSWGFESDNFPAALNWIQNGWKTNTDLSIYNVNQVWYSPRSLGDVYGLGFLESDIALATLDTPAFDIPTWTLLFSPLTEETHAVIVGYGATGFGSVGDVLGIDFRRRAAENMLSGLVSLNDVDDFLFGENSGLPQSVYQMDFDDPLNPPFDPSFDFDVFDGEALPGESITAGGDSGGPLIVDEAFNRPVVVGVLSGGSRYFAAQPFSSYGSTSFHQPLFLFWDQIVANNPYVYAAARPGNADWMDARHWVQTMDPNYAIVRNGALYNGLPDTAALGVTGNTTKFGNVCFDDGAGFEVCQDYTQSGPGENSTGAAVFVPGGPGTRNFVPNNIEPNPLTGVRARYYDVTLSSIGETYLRNSVTIDRFAIDGLLTSLDVRKQGTLNVLGDFTIGSGFVNIDGRVNSGEALLVRGLLTGEGTFNPTYLTSVDGAIAPGDLIGVGTLRVQGDVILASGNELLIELGKTTGDQLRVLADPAQGTTGSIALGGDLWLAPALTGGAPRYGNSYVIVRADGQVVDRFGDVEHYLGILRPRVTYLPNAVRVDLEAGRFADLFLHSPLLMPFAYALDDIRERHYADLADLYERVDLLGPDAMERAFSSLAPASFMDARALMSMQDMSFSATLSDRMSLISRGGGAPGFSMMGAPGQILAFGGDEGLGAAQQLAFASMMTPTTTLADMPNGMSAFVTGGYDDVQASALAGRTALRPEEGLHAWRVTGGVEQRFGAFTLGVGAAYARGEAMQSGVAATARNDVAQAAVYGVYQFERGIYVSGLVGMGTTRAETERRFAAGDLDDELRADTQGSLVMASLEAGVNLDIGDNFTLTPRASVRQSTLRVEGFEEAGGAASLSFGELKASRLEARLGASLNGAFVTQSGWRIAPSLDAALVSNLAGDEDGVLAWFTDVPDARFYLPGLARDNLWGEIGGGVTLTRGLTSVSIGMEGDVGRQELHENRYVARFAQRF